MFTLVTSHFFEKQLAKFAKRHPALKPKIADILRKLEKDPLQNVLRLHPLQGKLKGLFAIRVTYQYRITLVLIMEKKEVILLDIGGHDEVYRKEANIFQN